MLHQRSHYLNKLLDYKDNETIKVITGVRRAGKSHLLLLLKDFLTEQEPDADILYFNFEHPQTFPLHDGAKLYAHLRKRVSKKRVYFLFDEIQLVRDWQRYVNGLRVEFDCDIYLTGSNANLLSGELATLLGGRFVEIPVFPLSFGEYMSFRGAIAEEGRDRYFRDYLKDGGFPLIALTEKENVKAGILRGISDSIVFRDVAARGSVKDTDLLQRLILYLMDNIGNSISATKIANYLNSSGEPTRSATVSKYLGLLEDAFVFYHAQRYDIRGKEYLKTLGKFYTVDLGLRNEILGRWDTNRGSQIENLVYLRLLQLGYSVYVGKYEDVEIDFVCFRGSEVKYVQVCERLPIESERETRNLLRIPDNYERKIITMNKLDVGIRDGIEIVHIYDFLTEDF